MRTLAVILALGAFVLYGAGTGHSETSTPATKFRQAFDAKCEQVFANYGGETLKANHTPAEAEAWGKQVELKLADPQWVWCMNDKFGPYLPKDWLEKMRRAGQ
jgi:hypothetical protein